MFTEQTAVERIQSMVVRITHHIDARRWADLRSLYDDRVETDYRSMGGKHLREASDELIERWRTSLEKVRTQHLLGPVDVSRDADRARAECHVRACHWAEGLPGGDSWIVFGHYVIDFGRHGEGWLIQKMTLETFRQEGKLQLMAEVGK
jgi:3-phenylpropionate/cinnamic acid dioxygenase small subunit